MAKITELWQEVEQVFAEKTSTALKMAILEAHKILEAVLDSKKYPGKTVERKLFWAGYSLKGKDGLAEALEKHHEILYKFDYLLTNIEAEDILKVYRNTINEIGLKPEYTEVDRLKAFLAVYFSPKSVLFWRNIGILGGFFALVKFFSATGVGKNFVGFVVLLSDFIISWQFLVVVIVVLLAVALIINYQENKSKVVIKEEN